MKINEDILNECINESIDEFLIEEGWGDAFRKVGSWLKDGFNHWMQWGTDGKWGQNFDARVSNNKMNEVIYLGKWFNYHLQEIERRTRYNQDPSANEDDNFTFSKDLFGNFTGKRNSGDIAAYVLKNVTPYNFNKWVSGFIKDRNALQCIDSYITKCNNEIMQAARTNDPNAAIRTANSLLTKTAFLSSEEGVEYMSTKRSELKSSEENDNNANNTAKTNNRRARKSTAKTNNAGARSKKASGGQSAKIIKGNFGNYK